MAGRGTGVVVGEGLGEALGVGEGLGETAGVGDAEGELPGKADPGPAVLTVLLAPPHAARVDARDAAKSNGTHLQ